MSNRLATPRLSPTEPKTGIKLGSGRGRHPKGTEDRNVHQDNRHHLDDPSRQRSVYWASTDAEDRVVEPSHSPGLRYRAGTSRAGIGCDCGSQRRCIRSCLRCRPTCIGKPKRSRRDRYNCKQSDDRRHDDGRRSTLPRHRSTSIDADADSSTPAVAGNGAPSRCLTVTATLAGRPVTDGRDTEMRARSLTPGGNARCTASTALAGSGVVAATLAPSRTAPTSSILALAIDTTCRPATSTMTTIGMTRTNSTVTVPRSSRSFRSPT